MARARCRWPAAASVIAPSCQSRRRVARRRAPRHSIAPVADDDRLVDLRRAAASGRPRCSVPSRAMPAYDLPPERLERWLERWAGLHGGVASTVVAADAVTLTAADGATVRCEP